MNLKLWRVREWVIAVCLVGVSIAAGLLVGNMQSQQQRNDEVLKTLRRNQAGIQETLETLQAALAAAPEGTRRTILQIEADIAAQLAEVTKAVNLRQQGVPARIVIVRTKTRVIVRCELPNGKPCPGDR